MLRDTADSFACRRMTSKHRAISFGRCDGTTSHRRCWDAFACTRREKPRHCGNVVRSVVRNVAANAAKLPRVVWSCCYCSDVSRERSGTWDSKESRHAPARRDMHGWNSHVYMCPCITSRERYDGVAARDRDLVRDTRRRIGIALERSRRGTSGRTSARRETRRRSRRYSRSLARRAEASRSARASVRRSVGRSMVDRVCACVGRSGPAKRCVRRRAQCHRRSSCIDSRAARGRLEFSRP